MPKMDAIVNVLVVLFALFFCFIGVAFLVMTFRPDDRLDAGPAWQKGALGLVFLLAAAPMMYYVFSKNARGLPPVQKKARKPAERPPGPPV